MTSVSYDYCHGDDKCFYIHKQTHSNTHSRNTFLDFPSMFQVDVKQEQEKADCVSVQTPTRTFYDVLAFCRMKSNHSEVLHEKTELTEFNLNAK